LGGIKRNFGGTAFESPPVGTGLLTMNMTYPASSAVSDV